MMKDYLLILFCVMFQCSVFGQTEHTIILKNKAKIIPIGQNISFLEDETGKLTIDDILKPKTQKKFQNHNKNVFYRQPSMKTYWLKITFKNQTQKEACIELAMSNIFYLDYFQNINGKYIQTIKTGCMRPEKSKAFPVNVFWLPLSTGPEMQVVYIKFSGQFIASIPIYAGTFEALSYNKDKGDCILGGFIGIMIVMFFFNFFLLLITQDKIYAWYLAYLIPTLVNTTFLSNYPFITYFFEDLKPILYPYYVSWGFIAFLMPSLFTLYALDLFKKNLFFARFILIANFPSTILIPILNISGIAKPYQLIVFFQLNMLAVTMLCIGIGIYLWVVKKEKFARFFTLGWSWAILGGFILLLSVNGILPYNYLSRNAMFFGFCLESILFSLALGDRINTMRTKMQLAQAENFKLIQEQNQVLELKVKERTEELESINEELKQSNEELNTSNEKISQASKDLEHLNATKDKLFAIIGHDLRSPIHSLKGLMSLVDNEDINQQDFLMLSGKLKNSVEYIHFTLDNLLQWANNQMQGIQNHPENIHIYNIAKENCDLLGEIALKKQIKINNEIDNEIMVWADTNQVSLIFRNLISNAIKFTNMGGTVQLIATQQKDFYQMSVIDTGIGMSQNVLEKLFNPLMQVKMFGTQNEKGTGLGLILCKDFVEKNGGEIWAESQEGKGSKFHFTLPIQKQ